MIKYFLKILIRNLLKIFWILPVNPLKLCLQSFRGLQPTCNPLYIFDYLSSEHPEYKYVWLVNEIPEQRLENVLYVKKHTMRWFYEILTSRIIITNNGFYSYIPFRKKTVLIETWHGGGAYKKVGFGFNDKSSSSIDVYKSLCYYAKHLAYHISSSKKFTQIMSESTFVDEKKFLPIGMPRNDMFFDTNAINNTNIKVRKQFGINEEIFVVLYAPTYRGGTRTAYFDNNIDVQSLKYALIKKFRKNVLVLFRGHHLFLKQNAFLGFDMDVSNYPDMQELLCATDMLITDYSSSMWDFSLLKRPCFLFVPDFDDYLINRGFYTDPLTWGFPICKTNEELQERILSFDTEVYISAIQKHHENLGSFETGTATKSIANIIVEKMGNKR